MSYGLLALRPSVNGYRPSPNEQLSVNRHLPPVN